MTGSAEQRPDNERIGRLISISLAAVVAVIAVVTLAGYAEGFVRLVQLNPDWQAMSLLTVLLCLGLAAALTADALISYRIVHIAGTAVLLMSAALLIATAYTGHDPISPLLIGAFGDVPIHGETSIATAFSAGMLAIGCLSRPRAQPAAVLAIAVMLIAALAVLGYAYGVKDLYAISPFRTMSLRTAVSLLLLGLGFLLSNNESGVAALVLDRTITGLTTRRQLGFLLLPPIVAYGLLRATRAGLLGPGGAMALLVVLTVAPLAALILRDARALTRLNIEREHKRRADKGKLAIERRYRSLFNSLEAGFCVIELAFDAAGKPVDYRFLEVNPAFAGHTGLVDAAGKWMRELDPNLEQYRLELYGRVARTGEPARTEYQAATLGRFFDVSAFRVDEPDAHHVAVLFSDISARRRAELDMKALNETLEHRVVERAAELEKTQEALRQSQKLEAIGQLTGGVAHDFNNLLTVIQGSVELLRRPGLTEERRHRFTDAIGEAAGRATKLTSQLLSFARRQTLRPETFDIGEALDNAMGILGTLTGAGTTIDLKVPVQPCYVHADRSQFDAAIVNMVVNARDAMNGAGQITITVGPVSGIPALRLHPPVAGDFMAVVIKDSGTGIASDKLSQIFEPFFTTKGVGSGTGLGLSQVIGFAKQSEGDVRVDSSPGEGATFTLYLPREYVDPLQLQQLEVGSGISGEGIRVLVVEDNAHVGEFALQSLEELGYRSVLATDAEQGLALLAADRSRYDIVFSDVVMPGRSGLEMAEDIRRLYPDLPVVLTSGYSHVLAENGSHGFELLHKPYSIEQLSRVLRKMLAWTETAKDTREAAQ